MAKHPHRLPQPLSERLANVSANLITRQGREIDVALGGIPFLLATTSELPQTTETIVVRKDQLDTEADPGEQSLTSWWRRSQDSFHEGAGNLYQESRSTNTPSSGFFDSEGVDPWTQGELTLLRRMVAHSDDDYTRVKTYYDSTGRHVSAVNGASLNTFATPDAAAVALHTPVGKTLVDGLVSNDVFYDVADDGTLYSGTVASPGTATTWPLGSTPSRMRFGKHRLWVIGENNIWQPDLSLAGSTAQNPVFTHPNTGWTYTAMAEGPQAMYFAGHDGNSSSIQAISMENDGSLPTLTGAVVTTILPDGELVQEIQVLAGQFIGIGTTRGFRVGVIDGVNITYGPLLIEDVTNCTAITTSGRFFVVAFEATDRPAECYKVDTSVQLVEGIFPYARDAECASTGHLTSLADYDGRVLATDQDGFYWYQHEDELVETGYLQTGRIRFRTTERKLFKYVELDTEPLEGTIVISGLEENGTNFDIHTFADVGEAGTPPLSLTTALGPQRQVALKFTLVRAPFDAAAGPVLNSYLLRAMPSVRPQRLITLPLLCYDEEMAHSGHRYGYEGYANDRLEALQLIENESDIITYQNFTVNGATGLTVVIESLRFVQNQPANPNRDSSGRGGILIAQLRTVTA